MSKFPDAIGYLLALRDEIPLSWFSRACDFAIASTDGIPSSADLVELADLFVTNSSYTPLPAPTLPNLPTTASTAQLGSCSKLEELSDFVNFKNLKDSLKVTFSKRITIAFGTNGSGKSSICDAVKVLASTSPPDRPLRNVKASLHTEPQFGYRLAPSATPIVWSKKQGYGAHASLIKCFDSTIAIGHLTNEIEPRELQIELEPFRLEVFDYCRKFVTELRTQVGELISTLKRDRDAVSLKLREQFVDLPNTSKAAIIATESGAYDQLSSQAAAFTPILPEEHVEIERVKLEQEALLHSVSDTGIMLLKSRSAARRRIQRSVDLLLRELVVVDPEKYNATVRELNAKLAAQEQISGSLAPSGAQFTEFVEFLKTTHKLLPIPTVLGDPCPYCQRPLDEDSLRVVQSYHAFLTNRLQQEIESLVLTLRPVMETMGRIRNFELDMEDDTSAILNEADRLQIIDLAQQVIASIPRTVDPKIECVFGDRSAADKLAVISKELSDKAAVDEAAIHTGQASLVAARDTLANLTEVLARFQYRNHFGLNIEQIRSVVEAEAKVQFVQGLVGIAKFPSILGRLTKAGTDAESELVVADYENQLNREYRLLSGQTMTDFGVCLRVRGEQQNVAVEPQIGEVPIRRVLSEGEQKIHALAMFFCEAMQQQSDIYVFDDPSTSFDYDHIRAFAERLCALAKHYGESQFVVFTHCWEFFVHLQLLMNKSGLNNDTEVQVVEHCRIAKSYTEKLEELKNGIETLLATPGVLDSEQTELLAARMRRYVEAILNTCVFNGQRHQFKQKSQPVTVFREAMSIVPLLKSEADDLSNFYSRLSPLEHDDPTNHYTNRSKAEFQTWYDDLVAIDTAVMSRRP